MHNRRDDTGCCSRVFLKSIMVAFNTFFWLSGIAFLLIGVGSFFLRHHYISLLDSHLFPITTYLFIAIGGIILLVGVVGCLGTLKELRCCLLFYVFVLMLVFLLETCAGVLAYMYESTIHEELARNLNQTIATKYDIDADITKAVDHMQSTFQCCGVSGMADWQFSHWTMERRLTNDTNVVPMSCCITKIAPVQVLITSPTSTKRVVLMSLRNLFGCT
uniref:Tetraspanin n=1 Tax=Arion vulgaris TaxID=1028688 RepID=A0A0B7ALX6_9EUPU